jgi:hypothetical protein
MRLAHVHIRRLLPYHEAASLQERLIQQHTDHSRTSPTPPYNPHLQHSPNLYRWPTLPPLPLPRRTCHPRSQIRLHHHARPDRHPYRAPSPARHVRALLPRRPPHLPRPRPANRIPNPQPAHPRPHTKMLRPTPREHGDKYLREAQLAEHDYD